MDFENEHIEFKSGFTEEIYKEVIAFANTDGGVIYVGVDNDGNVVGLQDVDDEYTRITNGIRDAILPDVTMFVQFSIQENKVVRIAVGEGTNKPYFLKGKGLKPSGVYVRQGATSAPASYEQIRQMIKESDGDSYEEMRSQEQALSFTEASMIFKRLGVEFGQEKFRALGLTDKSGDIFTNLALILSDQCPQTIKIAVFGDDQKTVFKDSKEFHGSVLSQLENAFDYLKLCNKTKSVFSGIERIETTDYPIEALREALLNAVVHRDYGFSGSIIINVSDRETEFISIGGLVSGLDKEDILSGISQPRNKNLAEVFHRLRLIESYGTGIRKIYALYEKCPYKPNIEVTANTFKMVLPNMNAQVNSDTPVHPINEQMSKIIGVIKENGKITDPEIETLLSVKRTRAYILTKEMTDMGLIKPVGRGKEKYYILL